MIIDKSSTNDELKAALVGEKELIQSAQQYLIENDEIYDDEQRKIFKRYLSLPQFEKDLIYLSTRLPVAEIARLYSVTSSYIYIRLKKANKLLRC